MARKLKKSRERPDPPLEGARKHRIASAHAKPKTSFESLLATPTNEHGLRLVCELRDVITEERTGIAVAECMKHGEEKGCERHLLVHVDAFRDLECPHHRRQLTQEVSPRARPTRPRFPNIGRLFHELITLRSQTAPLVQAIEILLSGTNSRLPEGFAYTAPQGTEAMWTSDGPLRAGRLDWAPETTKAWLRGESPALESRKVLRATLAAGALDRFHFAFRAWRAAVSQVRAAVDRATEELDGATPGNIDERSSIRLKAAIGNIVAAVAYDPELEDSSNYPPVSAQWLEQLEKAWDEMTTWVRICRQAAFMELAPRLTGDSDTHVFQRSGSTWHFRFGGVDRQGIPNRRGFEHLAQLLAFPSKPLFFIDLHAPDAALRGEDAALERMRPVATVPPRSQPVHASIDPAAREAVLQRIAELEEQRSFGDLSPSDREEAQQELNKCRHYLDTGLRPNGAPVDLDADKRAVNAVRQSINQALAFLDKLIPELAAHLESSVKLRGRQATYEPAGSTPSWVL